MAGGPLRRPGSTLIDAVDRGRDLVYFFVGFGSRVPIQS